MRCVIIWRSSLSLSLLTRTHTHTHLGRAERCRQRRECAKAAATMPSQAVAARSDDRGDEDENEHRDPCDAVPHVQTSAELGGVGNGACTLADGETGGWMSATSSPNERDWRCKELCKRGRLRTHLVLSLSIERPAPLSHTHALAPPSARANRATALQPPSPCRAAWRSPRQMLWSRRPWPSHVATGPVAPGVARGRRARPSSADTCWGLAPQRMQNAAALAAIPCARQSSSLKGRGAQHPHASAPRPSLSV